MLGTKDFALPAFEYLCETGHGVVALITQPDRPQGRKQLLIPSRIKEAALARGSNGRSKASNRLLRAL